MKKREVSCHFVKKNIVLIDPKRTFFFFFLSPSASMEIGRTKFRAAFKDGRIEYFPSSRDRGFGEFCCNKNRQTQRICVRRTFFLSFHEDELVPSP